MVRTQITLCGQHADRFEEIRESLEAETGLEHGNADTLRALMAEWSL